MECGVNVYKQRLFVGIVVGSIGVDILVVVGVTVAVVVVVGIFFVGCGDSIVLVLVDVNVEVMISKYYAINKLKERNRYNQV